MSRTGDLLTLLVLLHRYAQHPIVFHAVFYSLRYILPSGSLPLHGIFAIGKEELLSVPNLIHCIYSKSPSLLLWYTSNTAICQVLMSCHA